MLKDQAALTYHTEIRGKVTTLEDALKRLRATFLSEEARRANDTVWEQLNYT